MARTAAASPEGALGNFFRFTEQGTRCARGIVVLIATLAFLAACTSTAKESSPSPTLARIQARRALVVGTAGSMPPLNMTMRNGEVIGFEIDLARAMAEAMNVKLRLTTIPFPDLLPALEAGRVDVILSGMTITPERSLRVAFVGPYFVSGKSFLTKATTLASVKDASELNDPRIRLAALRASTSQTFVEQVAPRATLVSIRDYDEGVNLVLQDQVDAMVADFPVCVFSVFRYPDRGLYALVTPLTHEPIGIALPKNDAALETWTRNWLQGLEASGALERMRDRWFKDASWLGELP
jgi:polar amino acid transport system substrate-binding protein